MVAPMNELSAVKLLDSAVAIRKAFPTFESQFRYKKLLEVAKSLGERTPERTRAEIEAQAALASTIAEAIERGEVSKQHGNNSGYQLGTHEIASSEVDRWRKLAAIPDGERQAYYDAFEKWSRDALLKWWKSKQVEGEIVTDSVLDCEDCRLVTDLGDIAGEKFGTIYADPPWAYGNQGTRAATGNHYGTMTIADICAMPIADLAANDSHLHLWTTNSFLREAFQVIDAWGFEYKSCAVWCKPQMGIGNYVRVSHEFLLIAVRGDCKSFKQKNVMSWFEQSRGKHSSKPDYWRKVIEENSPAPRLEIFGRQQFPGWTIYGNQISGQQKFA